MDVPQLMQVQLQTRIVTAQCVIVLTSGHGIQAILMVHWHTPIIGVQKMMHPFIMNVVDC